MTIKENIHKNVLLIVLVLVSFKVHCQNNFVTKIEVVGKSPSQIYNFMFSLNKEKYIAWHQTVHKDFSIVKQTKDTVGSIFFFYEKMDNLTVKYKWKVVEIIANQKIVMKANYFIPIYLTLVLTN